MEGIKENIFYKGNFYHEDQLLRFKWAKKQKDVFIYKSRGYNTKHKWYLWDVVVETKCMKMFYDNNEFTFYVYNEKTKKYNYWMTANTLKFSSLNSERKTSINPSNSLEDNITDNDEPIVCIELCFIDNIESHPIETSE
jgi:hypothetical protein